MKAPANDRFPPRGELPPEQLKAYAEGRLDAEAQHEVELHLEQDSLAREAAEGMAVAGALTGLPALEAARPKVPAFSIWPWLAGGAVVLFVGGGMWMSSGTPNNAALSEVERSSAVAPLDGSSSDSAYVELAIAEIEAAVEIPETLHIGHANTDRHAITMRTEVRPTEREVIQVERLASRPPDVDTFIEPSTVKPVRVKRNNIQLMYLYDLKLVDPKGLYAVDPMLLTDERHVTPNFSDRNAQRTNEEPQRRMHYTPFMERAMGKFDRNDHKGCLEDLRFLLTQYPDDVNALFYAGLCSYNLGMNERARDFLHRAAIHSIAVFDEEAVWYHALTLARSGENAAANEAFQRIATNGGFYADRAKSKLERK